TGSDLSRSILTGVKAIETKLNNVDLTYSDLSHADVTKANLSGAKLFRTKLHKIKEEQTQWDTTAKATALGDDAELSLAEAWRPPY
ncbi:MAG: pentapeptide repeat-containing protein, partial [Nitrospirota bacterium]|nr:pentapeptide repeat-containing protein [Nitrospirota bacterium]